MRTGYRRLPSSFKHHQQDGRSLLVAPCLVKRSVNSVAEAQDRRPSSIMPCKYRGWGADSLSADCNDRATSCTDAWCLASELVPRLRKVSRQACLLKRRQGNSRLPKLQRHTVTTWTTTRQVPHRLAPTVPSKYCIAACDKHVHRHWLDWLISFKAPQRKLLVSFTESELLTSSFMQNASRYGGLLYNHASMFDRPADK